MPGGRLHRLDAGADGEEGPLRRTLTVGGALLVRTTMVNPSSDSPAPRMARTHGELIPALENMGINDAFTCEADFFGIFVEPGNDGDTNIGLVEHEAFVAVDEAGTEAAAVAAVVGIQKV
jgi:serine protease inhibitor